MLGPRVAHQFQSAIASFPPCRIYFTRPLLNSISLPSLIFALVSEYDLTSVLLQFHFLACKGFYCVRNFKIRTPFDQTQRGVAVYVISSSCLFFLLFAGHIRCYGTFSPFGNGKRKTRLRTFDDVTQTQSISTTQTTNGMVPRLDVKYHKNMNKTRGHCCW